MLQKICKILMRIGGWTGENYKPPYKKCIIVGAPHTSAWDFVWAWIYYTSIGGKMSFLIKKEFFFWPLGFFIRRMGGIPIDRSKGANVIRQSVKLFEERESLQLAITPEGTRKRTKNWKAGFHAIARQAKVPVFLSSFDWGQKFMTPGDEFQISDDYREDIKRIKDYYREKGIRGKHPEQFTTEY